MEQRQQLLLILAVLVAALFFVAPAYAQESLMLEALSDQGSFLVQITWTPADVGEENTFDIRFIEPETRSELEDIKYEISISQGGRQELRKVDQTAAQQRIAFDEPGQYMIRIGNIDGLDESALIPIEVTPEFTIGAVAAMAAVGVAIVAGKINLFRLQLK